MLTPTRSARLLAPCTLLAPRSSSSPPIGLVQFEILDFPGDFSFQEDLVYRGQVLTKELIFGSCGALVYVIDAQDDPSADAISKLHEIVKVRRPRHCHVFDSPRRSAVITLPHETAAHC